MENGSPSTGRDQAAHGRPEQAHTECDQALISTGRASLLEIIDQDDIARLRAT